MMAAVASIHTQGMEAVMARYWYNVQTHEVEKDAQSGWQSLIGPYDSRE